MYKVTFIFDQRTGRGRSAGWSETWYRDGSLTAVTSAADSWAKKRAAFLTTKGFIVAFRLQEIGQRARLIRQIYPGVIGTDQDIPQMALQCAVLGAGVNNKKIFQLRGMPDSNVLEGDYTPTPAFNTALSQFQTSLVTQSFRFRAKDLTQAQVRIVSVTALGVFSLAGPITFNVGDTIDFLRAKNIDGKTVSGSYYVSAKVDGQNGTILGWTGGVVQLKGNARRNLAIYPLVLADSFEIATIGTRKVGRPFGLYHGRAQVR